MYIIEMGRAHYDLVTRRQHSPHGCRYAAELYGVTITLNASTRVKRGFNYITIDDLAMLCSS